MEPKIIHPEDCEEKDYGDTKVTDLINSEDWPFFSIAKVRKTGNNIKTGYDSESNVTYYVLEGEGIAVINGKEFHIKKGDLVLYPKGTKYKHLKGLTLLAIANPLFDRKKRVYKEG